MRYRSMARLSGAALVATVTLVGFCTAVANEPQSRITTLCDLGLMKDLPSSVISFQATASTDLHHGITLSHPACRSAGLKWGPSSDSTDQSVERFLHELTAREPYLTWRSLSGTFTGTIALTPAGERRFVPLAVQDLQELADAP